MASVSNVLVRGLRRGVLMCAFPVALLCAAGAAAADFNDRGNIVIADQVKNRVIEIDPHTHAIVWQFGNGSGKNAPPNTSRKKQPPAVAAPPPVPGNRQPPAPPPPP